MLILFYVLQINIQIVSMTMMTTKYEKYIFFLIKNQIIESFFLNLKNEYESVLKIILT